MTGTGVVACLFGGAPAVSEPLQPVEITNRRIELGLGLREVVFRAAQILNAAPGQQQPKLRVGGVDRAARSRQTVLRINGVEAGDELAHFDRLAFFKGRLQETAADLGGQSNLGRLDVTRGVDAADLIVVATRSESTDCKQKKHGS